MAKGAPDYAPWSGAQRLAATGGGTIFSHTVTIPKNTSASSPITDTIALAKGFVTRVEIVIPRGCAGLVGIAIFNQATQLFPGAAATWFTGDNEHIYFDTDFDCPKIGASYQLSIKAYNTDDTYAHHPIVRCHVVFYP